MDNAKVAQTLVYLYLASTEAERPIDIKVAAAALTAGCKVANSCGYGFTPDHVKMSVIDAHRDTLVADGERPAFRAVGNRPRKEWDANFIARTEIALAAIV